MPHQLNIKSDFKSDIEGPGFIIKLHSEKPGLTDVCVFSSYSFSGTVDEYVFYYLKAINEAGFSIAFVSTSPLKEECVRRLEEFAFLIIEKENNCPDFGAWKIGLTLLNWGSGLNSVLLANDSVFGPFYDLTKIMDSMRKRFDVWGMTDSYEIEYHIQSYFLYFNKKAVNSHCWSTFWKDIDFQLPLNEVIHRYEVGISQVFIKEKFRVGAYAGIDVVKKSAVQQHTHINAALAYWKMLIEQYEFPFLKRKIIISWKEINEDNWNKGLYINVGSWRRFLAGNTKYPVNNIVKFMNQYYQYKKKQNKNVALRKRKILFLSHNADIGGAQRVLLNFLSWFKNNTDIPFETVVCFNSKNRLLREFSTLGNVTHIYNLSEQEKQSLKERLADEQVGLIFSNTIVNIEVQKFLSFLSVPQIVFVHELSYVLSRNEGVKRNANWLQENISHYIACADGVKRNLVNYLETGQEKVSVVNAFIEDPGQGTPEHSVSVLKKKLGIPADAFVVGLCGTFEWRKAADLLPLIAVSVCRNDNDIHLVWLGAEKDTLIYEPIEFDLEKANLSKRVHLVEKQLNSVPFFSLFDILLTVSREDPFPLTN
ncbi:MAG: rhamnan synthesis F family protein, partial [Bacteroidota bacterium]